MELPAAQQSQQDFNPGALVNTGKNKIRVVIRMRPYLDNEIEEIESMTHVQASGQIRVNELENEVDVYPNSAYPGQNAKQHKKLRFDKVLHENSDQADVYGATEVDCMV